MYDYALPNGGGQSRLKLKECGPGTLFNPETMICDWEASVLKVRKDCGEGYYTTTTTEATTSTTTSTTEEPIILKSTLSPIALCDQTTG